MEKRAGTNLEKLVEMLERQFIDDPQVKVERRKKLIDKVAGRKREHDVVVTRTDHHGDFITAIECRDRSQKVDVNAVENFALKVQQTGVHRAFIVSPKGFTETARVKAAFHSIGCIDLKKAESFSWFEQGPPSGSKYFTEFTYVGVKLHSDTPPVEPWTIYDGSGEPLQPARLQTILREGLDPIEFTTPNESPELVAVTCTGSGIYSIDAAGNRLAPTEVMIEYRLLVRELKATWELRDYESGAQSYEMAVCDIQLPRIEAKFVLIREPDGSGLRMALSKTHQAT